MIFIVLFTHRGEPKKLPPDTLAFLYDFVTRHTAASVTFAFAQPARSVEVSGAPWTMVSLVLTFLHSKKLQCLPVDTETLSAAMMW